MSEQAKYGATRDTVYEYAENKNASRFCTCTNLNCPFHPTKHNKGCTPCIAANLKTKDIPRCFFNRLGITGEISETSFQTFAERVLETSNYCQKSGTNNTGD